MTRAHHTCWDRPELCRGCSYCEQAQITARDDEGPVVYGDLSPWEAHLRDRRLAELMDPDRIEAAS